MTEQEFLQQLFLLRQDIEASPMLHAHDAMLREQWGNRLGDLCMRRLATRDTEKKETT